VILHDTRSLAKLRGLNLGMRNIGDVGATSWEKSRDPRAGNPTTATVRADYSFLWQFLVEWASLPFGNNQG
jgi:hypothetical protein